MTRFHQINLPLEMSKIDLDGLGLFGSILGHVGDGNFHETILFDGAKERASVEKCVHKMVDRALEMEGTCTVRPQPGWSCRKLTKDDDRVNMVLALERRTAFRRNWETHPSKS